MTDAQVHVIFAVSVLTLLSIASVSIVLWRAYMFAKANLVEFLRHANGPMPSPAAVADLILAPTPKELDEMLECKVALTLIAELLELDPYDEANRTSYGFTTSFTKRIVEQARARMERAWYVEALMNENAGVYSERVATATHYLKERIGTAGGDVPVRPETLLELIAASVD